MSKTHYMTNLTPKQRSEKMRQVRAMRKTPGYFATLSKEELSAISKRGGLAKTGARVRKYDKAEESSRPS